MVGLPFIESIKRGEAGLPVFDKRFQNKSQIRHRNKVQALILEVAGFLDTAVLGLSEVFTSS